MTSWKLRTAVPDDIEALRELITVSARGLNSDHYTPRQIESILRYVYGVDSQLVHDQTYFVVQDGPSCIGCGGWSYRNTLYGGDQRKAHDSDNRLDPAVDAARIRAFFVHPGWARKGIGSLLMNACEDAARKAGFHRMELMATLTGEHLYTRFGFTVLDETDVTLPDGSIMKVRRMAKDITPA